ncbi:MAG: hypothetical protein HeimC2_39680 [Candidatus Heimdallarchaeota archaeon LC_2]|nr:MAG: hypothetical protein HeimC2_39680 [Candidatus Heimdallarchaeota archaeon LC_2]
MKYITTGKPRGGDLPPNYLELLKSAKEWINTRKSSGAIESIYGFVPNGGFAIGNYDSHEKAWEDLVSYPLYSYLDWEVKPIIDFITLIDKIITMSSSQ